MVHLHDLWRATASTLTFTADSSGTFLALDMTTGKTMWHAGSGAQVTSNPITYELDGHRVVLTRSGNVLCAWTLAGSMNGGGVGVRPRSAQK